MENLKREYYKGLPADSLIKMIGDNLFTLKGVLNDDDFNFKKSKDSVNTTIELIERHLSALQEKISKD